MDHRQVQGRRQVPEMHHGLEEECPRCKVQVKETPGHSVYADRALHIAAVAKISFRDELMVCYQHPKVPLGGYK